MAVGLGYLLGRRKKLRTAMAVGSALAVGRFSRDPASLLKAGGELLGNSPILGQVSGLAKPLTAAGKAAAAGAVTRGIDSMGDRIKRRTDALRTDQQAEPDEQDDQDQQDDEDRQDERAPARSRRATADAEDEYDDDYETDENEPDDEPEEEPRPRPRKAPGLRRRPAPADSGGDNGNGAGARARRSDGEQADGGGAPVRRRVSKR
ncbi:hypothetical protein HH310_05875 [Actinoplanes sp. TBRC 11911]|uniref:hypothetical protein n=1 Tax=Actinoplanes sp. TBRC 11911 TaxID=2729386 RepID=UPI00145EEF1E|nr:hypothetical protein [Actinoplanes sp. TBRC 11911]NMO50721.1 hypothetical protein [Actinoplanes sp. TBRC 11911]